MDAQLINNLAPLVGTKIGKRNWNPSVAYNVCKNLRLASLVCLDVDKRCLGEYEFNNRVSIKTYNIHNLALKRSLEIIDKTYIKDVDSSDFDRRIMLFAMKKDITDSAIFTELYKSKKISKTIWNRYVLFIILDSFSLRLSLYDYLKDKNSYEYGELGSPRLDRLIGNIRFIKYALEKWDYKESASLIQHLNIMLYNVLRIKQDIKNEIVEVSV